MARRARNTAAQGPPAGFRLSARVESFRYALRGLRSLIASQHNAWIHAAATFAACGLALWLGLSRVEWAILALAIAAVWAAEGLNTALEALCDALAPERHPLVARAKDVAAGAVLAAALGAALVGCLLFGPRLLERLLD